MAYNTKEIITDKDGNPISQYYNPELDRYEPVEGTHGANKVLSVNGSGNPILSQMLGKITDIADNIGGGGGGALFYSIAAPDSINKERADLILTGDNDAQAINDAFTMLDNARGNNPDITIRIDFMGGNIVLDNDTQIVLTYDNFHIYGNGVRIVGGIMYPLLNIRGNNCKLSDTNVNNDYSTGISATNSTLTNCTGSGSDYGYGISATNSTLTNCTGSGSDYGSGISATNSTLTNCTGSGRDSNGIYANNSTLTNCTGESDYGSGIYAINKSIIQACDGTEGGISVDNTCYPNTLELLQQLNKGTITIR